MLTWICHEPKRTPCSLDDAGAIDTLKIAGLEQLLKSGSRKLPALHVFNFRVMTFGSLKNAVE